MTDRGEWLAWRREGVTATDVAKVVTGRYGGLWSVLAEKRGHEATFDDEQLDRMQRGKDLEDPIARMVEICTGLTVTGEETWCEHPEFPERRCTVDGFLDDDGDGPVAVLELKSHDVSIRPAWDYYRAQVQWQLHVTQMPMAILAVSAYDPDEDLIHGPRLEVIHPDQLTVTGLIAAADMVAGYLDSGEWPPPDGSPEADALIASLFPAPVVDDVVDLGELHADIEEYAAIKSLIAKGGRADVLAQRIKAAIGDRERGVAGIYEAVWSTPARKLDEQAVLADHPEFGTATVVLDRARALDELGKKGLDAYRTPSGARRLTVREHKESR